MLRGRSDRPRATCPNLARDGKDLGFGGFAAVLFGRKVTPHPPPGSNRVGSTRNECRGFCRGVGMTTVLNVNVTEERGPTAAEIEESQRQDIFLPHEEATIEDFPRLFNLSAGFMYAGMVRPDRAEPPDYVTIPIGPTTTRNPQTRELDLVVIKWNILWEAAQFRRRFFNEDDLPEALAKVADMGDVNVIFVPRTRSRYYEYVPLVHLLPRRALERFGLPLLQAGQWPFSGDWNRIDRHLPHDFQGRLAKAWAWAVWPKLNSGSGLTAFSKDDPIRLLAHNLDFWIPPVTTVIQETLGDFPEVKNGKDYGPVQLHDGSVLEGAIAGNPRMGGDIWHGEAEAAEMLAWTVNEADATGNLRGVLEAVRTHRVHDDFSGYWSNAREDFERKLHRKRNKVKVRFVELTDTIPVQGPDSEVLGKLVTNDFLALLDEKQREIVVLLNSGFRQHEIAEQMGYANHSPISKRLNQIRKQAAKYFDLD